MSTLLQPRKLPHSRWGRSPTTTCPTPLGATPGQASTTTPERPCPNETTCPTRHRGRLGQSFTVHLPHFPHPLGVRKTGTRGRHPSERRKKVTQKLEESTCNKCGQPTTTTRGLTTQTWDLTPITPTQASWAALLRGPVLALTQSGTTWRAQVDRNHIDIPTRHDTATHWLPIHQCWSPPLPGAGTPINLTPPGQAVEPDLFNQPADELPPY